jgi:hypothetical protein
MSVELTENDRAEIAAFADTGRTIVHRGREYAILNPPPTERRAESPYVLRSRRGKYFALMRNVPNPKMLFGVGLYAGMRVLPGWFTDDDGDLRSLS